MMKSIVITSSSRGIGFGLATAFLDRGCSVVVSGRTEESTKTAIQKLHEKYPIERVLGMACDVCVCDQVKALWPAAVQHFGKVDIWVNNAGQTGPIEPIRYQLPADVETVVGTNLTGVIYGSQVALRGMLEQGFGQIFNMEGMGSDGRMHEGMTLYGTTKYAQKYLNDALAKEVSTTPVLMGALRPGMVVTDLILDQYRTRPEEWKKVKKIFTLIADRVEVVTPFLVEQMLKNPKNGTRIKYSSVWKFLWRALKMPFTHRNIFPELS